MIVKPPLAAGQRKEKVVVTASPSSSGTAAVVLSAFQEQTECVIAPRYTLSFCCWPCQTTHDRTFLCSEALITGGL